MAWRALVPPELDAILDVAQRMAKALMHRHRGHFYPFAIVMTSAGEIQPFAGRTGGELPTSTEIMEALEADLRAEIAAGRIRALALGSEQFVPDGRSKRQRALVVELEAPGSDAAYVVQRISKHLLGRPTFGEIQIRTLQPRFFVHAADASASPFAVE
jgi:hypothetical protein